MEPLGEMIVAPGSAPNTVGAGPPPDVSETKIVPSSVQKLRPSS
jgi:hypothetical protein